MFSLVWAVVSVQHGAAAMTECGLIPALLNVVQLNMDGQVGVREKLVVLKIKNGCHTWRVMTRGQCNERERGGARVVVSTANPEGRRGRDG